MRSVYPDTSSELASRLRSALPAFVEASTTHVGAAAAAASLRATLTRQGLVSEADFDQCFAVARLTPGTNLLALYALLGSRIAAWPGAIVALAIGTVLPAVIATAVAAAYVHYSTNPLVANAMSGARAGALAVFLWAIVRLSRPVLQRHRKSGALFVGITAAVAASGLLPPLPLLLCAGAAGAWWLRPRA